MYIFVNRGLKMTPGKLGAQVGHAAVEAYRMSSALPRETGIVEKWYEGGHYAKLVMLAEDTEQLLVIRHYLEERGFNTKLIVDEGRTEIRPFSFTALGVEVVDRDDPHTAATFESFRTYKELKPKKKPWWHFGPEPWFG